MKCFFFIFLFLFVACNSFLHGQSYEFNHFTKDYQNIDANQSTILLKSQDWSWSPSDVHFHIPIGFSFEVEEFKYDTVLVSPLGIVDFFQNCGINQFDEFPPPVLYVYFSDFDDRGWWIGDGETPMTTIHYLTEGEEGNRIFKIEWNNVGFFGSIGLGDDFVNFQVWLYETDHTIEIHFGKSNITDPNDEDTWFYFPGPLMNWVYYTGCVETPDAEMLVVTGDANNPNHQFTTTEGFPALNPQTIDNAPNEGMVYQFKPTSVDIEENSLTSQLKLYPTIAEKELSLTFGNLPKQEYKIEVYSLEGELLLLQKTNKASEIINIANLPKGMYVVKVNGQYLNQISRFVKP